MNALLEYEQLELGSTQPVRRLYFELGKSLLQQGNYAKAMEHLADALNVQDGSVDDWKIYTMLYDICRYTNQPLAAKENLLKVIATAPPHISDEVIRVKNVENVAVETHAHKKEKEQVLLLQGKAEIVKNEGKTDQAVALLQKALQAATQVADGDIKNAVLLDLAELWIDEGQVEKANAILQPFGPAQSKDLNLRRQLLQGQYLMQVQQAEAAIAVAEAILQENAASLQGGVLKLQALTVMRRYKEALSHVHHLMATHSVSADLIFYKIEILLEGNINTEEAIKLLQELKDQNGLDFIKNKLAEPHIRFRPQHGNDNYFLAQVYKTFMSDFGVEAALQQADTALKENVHFDGYNYPHGIIYELKAALYALQQDYEEAARLYYLSGKEYYWNGAYKQADAMFAACYRLENEKCLKTLLLDNYWYYAECLVQRSYTQTDPYVDEELVKEAARIWYEAYARQKPSFNDAWAYLTATLIHEQLSKLPERQKQEDLFYCWFYAEHNILIDNTNPKAWGFISRAFRSNALDRNAAVLAQKAYELDKKEVFIWEEKATTLLNVGKWAEADEFLQKLIDHTPAEVVFKAYKGYALYHLASFAEAQKLMNEVVASRGDWMWGRHLRMMVAWMLNNTEVVKEDAGWIWSKRSLQAFKNITTHEFAYAAFLLGHEKEALALFRISKKDTYDEVISSLFFYCIYYGLKRDDRKLQAYYKKYKAAARHTYNFTELRNAFKTLCPYQTGLIAELDEMSAGFTPAETGLAAELHQFADGCAGCRAYGSIGWEAITLSFFRLSLEGSAWKEAFDSCMQFQMVQSTRVDNFHLWNRFYLALKEYFLNHPKDFLQAEVRRTTQAYADAAPFNSLESLADLYLIISITGQEQGFVSDALSSLALDIYNQAGVVNANGKVDEWLKIIAALLPELQLDEVEKARSSEQPYHAQCRQCGTEVISRSQKFCFSCGAQLA